MKKRRLLRSKRQGCGSAERGAACCALQRRGGIPRLRRLTTSQERGGMGKNQPAPLGMTVRKKKRGGLRRPPLHCWLALGFAYGDGDGFGELEGQVRVSSEDRIVYLRLMALDLRLVFVGWGPRVGCQVAVHTVDDSGGEHHLQLVLFDLQDAASDRRAARKHSLSVHLDGLDKVG